MKRTLLPAFAILSTLLLIASPVLVVGTTVAMAMRKRRRERELVP